MARRTPAPAAASMAALTRRKAKWYHCANERARVSATSFAITDALSQLAARHARKPRPRGGVSVGDMMRGIYRKGPRQGTFARPRSTRRATRRREASALLLKQP